jgi:serine/threonine-protein phosphatase 2A regulatory subunit B'
MDSSEDCPYGYAECLEILASIISGFMLPLKEDHKILMFEQCLVPLHRSKFLGNFHSSLLKAITVFLKKDGSVAVLAIFACLKYWP